MKRVILIAIILTLFCAVGAYAQRFENESEFYPKTVQIHRVYITNEGYRIDYIRQDYTVGVLWAPIEWFRGAAGIGEIAYGVGPAFPYVTFFYKDGEVDHFRLYLYETMSHESWGALDQTQDYSDNFPPADSRPVVNF